MNCNSTGNTILTTIQPVSVLTPKCLLLSVNHQIPNLEFLNLSSRVQHTNATSHIEGEQATTKST